MLALVSVLKIPVASALSAILLTSPLRPGEIWLSTPIVVPKLPKFPKPQTAYVAMSRLRGDRFAYAGSCCRLCTCSQVSLIHHGETAGVKNRKSCIFVQGNLDANELRDLDQVVALSRHPEQESDGVKHIAKNQLNREVVRIIVSSPNVEIATPPCQQAIDERNEGDDAEKCAQNHACNFESKPRTICECVESIGGAVILIVGNDNAACC